MPERKHRVQRMGAVYSSAKAVYTWLGPEDYETEIAFGELFFVWLMKLQHRTIHQIKELPRQSAFSLYVRLPLHPKVTESAADLLAGHTSDDDSQELKSDLLSIEPELWHKELWDLQCHQDAREAEDDGVCASWDHDGGIPEQRQRLDELIEAEWVWVDSTELHVFLLEGGSSMLDAATDVTCLWTKEDVGDELDSINYGQDPVDPAVISRLFGDEAHDEGAAWGTYGVRPNAHELCALTLEHTTRGHGAVAMGQRTSDIEQKRAYRTDKPHWSPPIPVRNRFPEEGCKT